MKYLIFSLIICFTSAYASTQEKLPTKHFSAKQAFTKNLLSQDALEDIIRSITTTIELEKKANKSDLFGLIETCCRGLGIASFIGSGFIAYSLLKNQNTFIRLLFTFLSAYATEQIVTSSTLLTSKLAASKLIDHRISQLVILDALFDHWDEVKPYIPPEHKKEFEKIYEDYQNKNKIEVAPEAPTVA